MKKLFITVIVSVFTIGAIKAQRTSISNFNAENISDTELSISVDYRFTSKISLKNMVINAVPIMKNGKANYKDVRYESHPLKSGDNQVNFKITKKPGGKGFSSQGIRVCMINMKSIILCEEFPFEMSWYDSKTVSPTRIFSFASSKDSVEKGETVTLSWETENASKVMLGKAGSTEFQEVPAKGSETVDIYKTSTYVLMASPQSTKGPAKVESSKIKISVSHAKPVMGQFYASRQTLRSGAESKLLWEVYNADNVTLNGEPVKAIGDQIVSPKRTTRYTLKAQKGDTILEEFISIYVTPFAPPKLSEPIYSLQVCKGIDTKNIYDRWCVSPDGPFSTGDKIYIMARFKNLPKGKHNVKRITYRGFFGKDEWTKEQQEDSSFENTNDGEGHLTIPIVNLGEGFKKLKIIFNDQEKTASEIIYCIDCSRVWE